MLVIYENCVSISLSRFKIMTSILFVVIGGGCAVTVVVVVVVVAVVVVVLQYFYFYSTIVTVDRQRLMKEQWGSKQFNKSPPITQRQVPTTCCNVGLPSVKMNNFFSAEHDIVHIKFHIYFIYFITYFILQLCRAVLRPR